MIHWMPIMKDSLGRTKRITSLELELFYLCPRIQRSIIERTVLQMGLIFFHHLGVLCAVRSRSANWFSFMIILINYHCTPYFFFQLMCCSSLKS